MIHSPKDLAKMKKAMPKKGKKLMDAMMAKKKPMPMMKRGM